MAPYLLGLLWGGLFGTLVGMSTSNVVIGAVVSFMATCVAISLFLRN